MLSKEKARVIFINLITSLLCNPSSAQKIIDLCHTLPNKIKPGLNIYNFPSLIYNPHHKFYNDQDLGSIFYYEWQTKHGVYHVKKNYEFLHDKPPGTTIYVINLGKNCKIQEYTIVNRDIQYNNRRCILLKAVGTK